MKRSDYGTIVIGLSFQIVFAFLATAWLIPMTSLVTAFLVALGIVFLANVFIDILWYLIGLALYGKKDSEVEK